MTHPDHTIWICFKEVLHSAETSRRLGLLALLLLVNNCFLDLITDMSANIQRCSRSRVDYLAKAILQHSFFERGDRHCGQLHGSYLNGVLLLRSEV